MKGHPLLLLAVAIGGLLVTHEIERTTMNSSFVRTRGLQPYFAPVFQQLRRDWIASIFPPALGA